MLRTNYIARQVAALFDYAKCAVIEQSRRLIKGQNAVSRTALGQEAATELIRLTDGLLRQYGRDIEEVDRTTRCFATDEFLVATYMVEPDLALYEISQHDHGENVSQVFVATWHASGTPDLRLYRDGPWRRRFQSFAGSSDPGPAPVLH